MSDKDWLNIIKCLGVFILILVFAQACSDDAGRYDPPDAMEYNSMKKYKRERKEYDKHYDEARRDASSDDANNKAWAP